VAILKVFRILLLLFSLCLFSNAEAVSCNSQELTNLANKVIISYQYDEEASDQNYIFNIIINNLPKGMYLLDYNYGARIYGTGDTIIKSDFFAGSVYSFGVFSGEGTCDGVKIRTIALSLPKYNYFADTQMCIDNPEFEMCDKWYQGSTSNFYKALGKYLEEKNANDGNIDLDSLFDNIATFIKANLMYLILSLLLLIALIVYLIIKKKKRVKL